MRPPQRMLSLLLVVVMISLPFGTVRAGQGPDTATVQLAGSLVDTIYGSDSAAAQKATTELLRRSGVPLARADGTPVALPDLRALSNATLYAELIPVLTRHTVDSSWTLRAFTQLLIDITYFKAGTPPALVGEMLAIWGKTPGDAFEEQLAGAAVRALAGHRSQVFGMDADPDSTTIDPLTLTLFITHALGTLQGRTASARQRDPRLMAAYASQSLCDAVYDAFTGSDALKKSAGEMGRDSITEVGKKAIEHFTPGLASPFGAGNDTVDIGFKVLTAILLRLGAELTIDSDKEVTTFKLKDDGETDYSKHFNLTAHAKFNSDLAQQRLGCLAGKGLEVPKNGDMEGYYVRWSKRGPDDKLTTATLVDGYKISGEAHPKEFDAQLKTDKEGKIKLELMPARYDEKDDETRGVEVEAHYVIGAKIEKIPDLPYSPSDVFNILTSGGNMEVWAAKKILDLVLNAITRYNYPTVTQNLTVKYHGQNIYRIKGSAKIWLFYIEAPADVDLLACEGLNKPFIGKGGINNISTTGWGAAAEALTGKTIPGDVSFYNSNLSVLPPFPPTVGVEYPFDITSAFSLKLKFSRSPDNDKEHLMGVIGEATLGTDGKNFSVVCDVTGLCDGHFKIEGVDSDPNCPNGQKISFHLDVSRKE